MDTELLNADKNNKINHQNTKSQRSLFINKRKKSEFIEQKNSNNKTSGKHFQFAIVIIDHNPLILIIFCRRSPDRLNSHNYSQSRCSRSNIQNNQNQTNYSRSNSNRNKNSILTRNRS